MTCLLVYLYIIWSVSEKFNFRDEVVYRGWGAQKLGCPEKVNIYFRKIAFDIEE